MKEGLYKLEVSGFGAKATGVAVLTGDSLLGGDSGYYFAGSITEHDGRLQATIRASRHTRDDRSAFGPLSEVTLELTGAQEGPNASFRGAARELRAINVFVTLTPILLNPLVVVGAENIAGGVGV